MSAHIEGGTLKLLAVLGFVAATVIELGVSQSFPGDENFSLRLATFSAALVASFACSYVYRLGRRRQMADVDTGLSVDGRKYSIWLRSFDVDAETIQVGSFSKTDIESYHKSGGISLEEAVVDTLSALGPVIALTQKSEALPPIGAYRLQFSDDDWQQRLIEKCENARAVVVMLGSSRSLTWEIETLPGLFPATQFVFLIPPGEVWTSIDWSSQWATLQQQCPALPRLSLDEISSRRIAGFIQSGGHFQEIVAPGDNTKGWLHAVQSLPRLLGVDASMDADIFNRTKKAARRAWLYPTLLIIGVLATAPLVRATMYGGPLIVPLMLFRLVNVYWLIAGWFYIIRCLRTPRDVRRHFFVPIVAGSLLNGLTALLPISVVLRIIANGLR